MAGTRPPVIHFGNMGDLASGIVPKSLSYRRCRCYFRRRLRLTMSVGTMHHLDVSWADATSCGYCVVLAKLNGNLRKMESRG